MDRHIYLTIKDNTSTKDEFDNFFPDIMTFPINKFRYTRTPTEVVLTQQNIDRMDLFMFDFYNITDYDDIILWLNNIEFKEQLASGDKFLLPDKKDLERFYIDFII